VLKREDIIGRGVTTTIYDGEPIVENRLAPKGAGGGLAAMIPSGMRAVAVRVNDVVGVAGFVVPGMRVDVLISGNPPNPNASQGSQTRTLLQNIEVLSAGQDFKKDNEGKPLGVGVVNLLVTPEQAEMLSLASNQTTIQLVLRNPLDTQMAKTPGTAVVELFAVNGPKKRPDPQKVYVRMPPKPAPPSAAGGGKAGAAGEAVLRHGSHQRRQEERNEVRYDSGGQITCHANAHFIAWPPRPACYGLWPACRPRSPPSNCKVRTRRWW
jgi:pilus assembly protein CpaB